VRGRETPEVAGKLEVGGLPGNSFPPATGAAKTLLHELHERLRLPRGGRGKGKIWATANLSYERPLSPTKALKVPIKQAIVPK
jgi:hypothetical protein